MGTTWFNRLVLSAFAVVFCSTYLFSQNQAAPTSINPHQLGESFKDWLALNRLNLQEICGKHKRGDSAMDYKSVCKKLSSMQDTGVGDFYTTDQFGRTYGWRFINWKLNQYSEHGRWYGTEASVPNGGAQNGQSTASEDELAECLKTGSSPSACLAQVQQRAMKRLAVDKPKRSPFIETYFIDANFDSNIAAVLTLDNKGEQSSDVLIQRFAADGTMTDSQLAHVGLRSTATIRVENPIAKGSGEARTVSDILKVREAKKNNGWMGWIKVVRTSDDVAVSGIWESLADNELTELRMDATKPHYGIPAGNGIVPAQSLMHFVFVNLSAYEVRLGWCQDATAECSPTDSTVVAPNSMRVFPIDSQKKHVGLRSSDSCVYLSGIVYLDKGKTRTFDSSTSISFETVK